MKFLFLIAVMLVVALVKVAGRRARGGSVARAGARKQWILDEFSRRKVRQWLLGIPLGAVALELLWALNHPLNGYMALLWPVAIFVVAASVTFSWHNWRCPACTAHLGADGWTQGRCPKCHATLR